MLVKKLLTKFEIIKVSLLIIFTFLITKSFSKPIVLEPITEDQSSEEIGFIFVQGALIKSQQYLNLSKKIQEKSTKFRTWVSITDAIFDLPQSFLGTLAINKAYKNLIEKGFKESSKIYLIGHSLGGIAAINFYIGNENSKNGTKLNIHGLIMMGSILQRNMREKTKDLNIMILNGELDGLMRITRSAEEFYYQNLDSTDKKVLKDLKNENRENKFLKFLESQEDPLEIKNSTSISVIVIEGLNHMSFASGSPSSFVASRDLKAEIPEEIGHQQISELINSFVIQDKNEIIKVISQTYSLLRPIIDAFEMEGSVHFNRPLQTTCHRGYCSKGSEWTLHAQRILSQEKLLNLNNVTMNITNDFVILSSLPPLGDLFHPKMSLKNNTFNLATYSQCSWTMFDKYLDGGFSFVSANEIGSKMYSRQCSLVYGAGHKKEETPFSIDIDANVCAEINKSAFEWALGKASNKTYERFNSYGQKLNFVNDKIFKNGFSWTYSTLKFTENKNTGEVDVHSYTMMTDIDAKPLPIFAPDGLDCYHYCKLLSPARAIEWIYVDGLRKKYHI